MPLKASCLMLFIVRLPSDSSVQKKRKKKKSDLVSVFLTPTSKVSSTFPR